MYCEKCGKYSGKYPLCKNCYYDNDEYEEDDQYEYDEDDDDDELICPICGEPTNIYFGNPRSDRLCRKHGSLANKGEIEQCTDCLNWKKAGEECICKVNAKKQSSGIPTTKSGFPSSLTILEHVANKIVHNCSHLVKPIKEKNTEINQSENVPLTSTSLSKANRCITCGYETDGKLFCAKCYSRYHEREILIKIKNCKEIITLDDFYEGYFECDDGHVVKSMAERDIDDYLFSKNIKHGYEIPLKLEDENGKTITLHPDFCIFDENSNPLYYIEYWGYDDTNRDYTKTRKFKMPLYKKSGITLVNIYGKSDLRNLKSNLQYKLGKIQFGIVNFEED